MSILLQTKQKKQLLDSLTENETPFRNTKTKILFNNIANLSLRGTTYDAQHLDKFLDSKFGERITMSTRYVTSNKKKASFITNSSLIRPSVSFMSQDRDECQKQNYVDLYDGPSSLQKRFGIPTLTDQKNTKLVFEEERNKYESQKQESLQKLKDVQDSMLKVQANSLSFPKEKREELQDIKAKLKFYQTIKEQHSFINKRDRVIKNSYRHGILGIVDPESNYSSVFYQERLSQKLAIQRERDRINAYRQKKLAQRSTTSGQIEIGSEDIKRARFINKSPEQAIDIFKDWKSKGKVNTPKYNTTTFQHLFVSASNVDREKQEGCMSKIKVERAYKLRQEEQKGKQFNIINGQDESSTKWVNTFKTQLPQELSSISQIDQYLTSTIKAKD